MSIMSIVDFLEFIAYKIFSKLKSKNSIKFSAWQDLVIRKIPNNSNVISNWCLKSNIHGIQNLMLSNYLCVKIIWLLGIIGTVIVSLIILTGDFTIYFSYESRSKHSIERNTEINFPAFTFCSQEDIKNEDILFEKICYDSFLTKNFSSSELIISNSINNYKCFSLNILEENVLATSSLDGNSGICIFSFNTVSDIFLYIHDQDIEPQYGERFTSFLNEYLVIGLRMVHRIILSNPYSDCIDTWDSINLNITKNFEKNKKYNYKACKQYCEQSYSFLLDQSLSRKCRNACPEKCDDKFYEFSQSLNSFEKNKSGFAIFFDDTNINKVEDTATIDQDSLISSIG